jgi:arachidonate 5-lipoxygenase
MTSSFGWHGNSKLVAWLKARIREMTGNDQLTFMQLYQKYSRELCVVVTNISEKSVEYCHIKTTPDLPIIDALRMTMATPGLCSPVKYRLNNVHDQLFADGGIFDNFPIHCFDGWWLSMESGDRFTSRRCQMFDKARLISDQNKFQQFNNKTLGFLVYDEFNSSMSQLHQQATCSTVTIPNNVLAKNWERRKQDAETSLSSFTSYTAMANQFIHLMNSVISDEKKLLSKSEFDDFIDKISTSHEIDLKLLFGTRYSSNDIWMLVKPSNVTQACCSDVTRYLDTASYNLYRRCRQRFSDEPIRNLVDFFISLQNNFHLANTRNTLTAGDVDRTVLIDVRYLTAVKTQLSQQDRTFLLQQGRQATQGYLSRYMQTHRASYCRDDLVNFIDDDETTSEIIDERDYTEQLPINDRPRPPPL